MGLFDGLFGKSQASMLQLRMSCFNIGTIAATPNAVALCEALGIAPIEFVKKHASGDFGVIDPEQRERNQRAISDARYPAVSAYPVGSSVVYVVTRQGDSTTVMTATDYVFYANGR